MKEERLYPLAFHGKGSDYFMILLVNAILCGVTLGLYYPWAKEKKLKFLYSNTTFDDTPFVFSGTGSEMFKGFIKAVALFAVLYGLCLYMMYNDSLALGIGMIYVAMIILVPVALHGAFRYRMAKTSWKGIRFGYNGHKAELVGMFIKGFILTLLTFGIYGAWFANDIRKYILSNIHLGDAKFEFTGNGSDYFWMNIKGYFLTLVTLGIYAFWWQRDSFEFFVNNLKLQQDDNEIRFRSTATGGGFAGLMILNFLIVIFTFGLGFAWTVTRTLNFVMENTIPEGYLSVESLIQSQPEFSDATAEDMADMMDIGMI